MYAGAVPNTELYKELHLENGFIPVDANMETEMKGVYAVGDIRVKTVRQVSTAVADGTIAAIHAGKLKIRKDSKKKMRYNKKTLKG